MDPSVKEFIDGFTIKDVMNIKCVTHEQYITVEDRQLTLPHVHEIIFYLSTAYFTIATELRLIALEKGKENESHRDQPEFKESEMYHLLSVLILAITITSYSPFLGHLLVSYNTHYQEDLMLK